ncbi:MAG: zinc dependent phospholipase C family protein [Methanobacterium sp.]|nr:zinc dependent phospholipase C family protein [Methanobacterium sp.]
MKKTIIMIIISFTAFLALVQPVSAWAAPNHYAIAEEVYYSLPADAQDKLDLSKMLDGADDPDYKFFDFQYHHYPASEEKANYWLLKGRECYQNEDYKQASYCFGVATHYLSDSVCPPHSGGNSGYDHTRCELQAILLEPHITDTTGDMNSTLSVCNQKSETAWEQWILTGDDKYIKQCLNKAADVSYLAVNSAVSP